MTKHHLRQIQRKVRRQNQWQSRQNYWRFLPFLMKATKGWLSQEIAGIMPMTGPTGTRYYFNLRK